MILIYMYLSDTRLSQEVNYSILIHRPMQSKFCHEILFQMLKKLKDADLVLTVIKDMKK